LASLSPRGDNHRSLGLLHPDQLRLLFPRAHAAYANADVGGA